MKLIRVPRSIRRLPHFLRALPGTLAALAISATSTAAHASIAYGSINNFDTVNDTGSEAHGFEIEMDDIHTKDVTYTFDWNHYGVPSITEDNTDPAHPKTFVRWASAKKADGTWAAYTAIPAGPIPPTQGHQFTDPSVNFGGEHFGAGYTIQPSAIKYNWLIDNGAGVLVQGPPVQVATPSFVYYPPVAAAPAQVQAAIVPPPPPVPDPLEFGDAIWVKEIRTTTHNNHKIALRDLVSDDPANPNDKNWANGEPDEVEVEWQILQTDHNAGNGGANGELKGAAENLNHGDEVVTRRYEFYKYTGPLDTETGEAMADSVAKDSIHGVGTKTVNGVDTDLSMLVVVGDFTGAQMSAVDVDATVGLIDNLQDGEINVDYPARTVVISGTSPFTATSSGALPAGMAFDEVTGIVSGTPMESGVFTFTVNATDATTPLKAKTYTFNVTAGIPLPPHALVDTVADPLGSGTTTGDGSYEIGTSATAMATPNAGYRFVSWIDHGAVVSNSASYTLTVDINHSLTANFAPTSDFTITASASPVAGGTITGDGLFATGANVSLVATASPGYAFLNWTESGTEVSTTDTYSFTASANRTLVANFAVTYQITTSAAPVGAGTTVGDGTFVSGSSVTVTATASAGYGFVDWTEAGTSVSTSASYQFTVGAARVLVANFSAAPAATPTNTSPATSANGQSLTPTLQASLFSGTTAGITHAASQWIVRKVSDSSIAFDSGTDATHLTSIAVTPALAYSTAYTWQVRYQDSNGTWSSYSTATSFTTLQQPVGSFANFKGTYVGLVESDEALLAGVQTVTVTVTGVITSSLTVNGIAYRLTGSFTAGGLYSKTVTRAGLPSLSVSLVLDTANGSDQIAGTITDGTATGTILLNRAVYTKANPASAPLVGTYTILLPPDTAHPEAAAPQGVGYGRLTVSALGAVSFSGTLGDGSVVTRATSLSKTGAFGFYARPYRDGGAAIGWLTIRDTANTSDLDGVLAWNKELVTKPVATTRYPAGFSLETAAIGSKYTVPARGIRAITLPGTAVNATIDISRANLAQPMPAQFVTVGLNNLVAAAPGSKFTMKLTPKTGLFSGTFVPPGIKKAIPFAGALFQKTDAAGFGDAAGLFVSQLQTGSVELIPAP